MDQYQLNKRVMAAVERWSLPVAPKDAAALEMRDLLISTFYKAIDRCAYEALNGRITIPTRVDSLHVREGMLINYGDFSHKVGINIGKALHRVLTKTEWHGYSGYDPSWNREFPLVCKNSALQFIDSTASGEEICRGWKERRRGFFEVI